MSIARANAGSLADLQRSFQDYLLVRSDNFAEAVRDTRKASRTTLLGVYRDAYVLRLIEVLCNDYPGVLAMAGSAEFDFMARAYIAAHPSHHPSVRWFGKDLADFLGRTPPFNGSPAAIEMARFEWTMGDAFDSPDVVPITSQELMAVPPEAWETLAFAALPSLHRLTLAYEVPQAWQHYEDVEPGNLEVEAAAEPVTWAIWRPERMTHFRSLEADELLLLDALSEGKPFPEMCDRMMPLSDEEQVMNRAVELLRGWIDAGMIASFAY
jgi:hypothetical protein